MFVREAETLAVQETLTDPNCNGFSDGSIALNILGGNEGPYTFELEGNTSDLPVFENLSAGVYPVDIIDANGCITTQEYILEDPTEFIVSLPSDTTILLGDPLDVLINSNESISDLTWLPEDVSPCGICTSFAFVPIISGPYSITAANDVGCIAEAAFNITVDIGDLEIYIPNAINPASLDINNALTIGSKDGLVSNVEDVAIYDRWGNIIHSVSNTTNNTLWDGRIEGRSADIGVYVYKIELRLIDNNIYTYVGSITVISE